MWVPGWWTLFVSFRWAFDRCPLSLCYSSDLQLIASPHINPFRYWLRHDAALSWGLVRVCCCVKEFNRLPMFIWWLLCSLWKTSQNSLFLAGFQMSGYLMLSSPGNWLICLWFTFLCDCTSENFDDNNYKLKTDGFNRRSVVKNVCGNWMVKLATIYFLLNS